MYIVYMTLTKHPKTCIMPLYIVYMTGGLFLVKTIGELGITVESGTVLSRIKAKDERDSVSRLVLLPKAVSEGIDLENMDTIDVDPGMIDAKRVKTTSSWDVVMKLTSPYEAVSIKPEYQEYVIPSYMAVDRKSTRLNSSHPTTSRMPSSA